jgi:D-3-phosphoglycerate dehydrogenase
MSLHIPAQADGQAIIDAEAIAKMMPGALLLNAARGGVVDEDAMLEALDSGQLGGAGVDVFVGEPKPRLDVIRHPRVSLTPHVGAATGAAQERIGLEIAQIVQEISAKQPA